MPKAAAHTIAAHLHSAAAVIALMEFSARDRWLLSLPLFHVSGLGILWRWLVSGATLTLADSAGFSAALARSSFASLVPTQLWRLLRQPERPAMLRSVLLGGAAIASELVQRAEAAGIRCFCGYGMTESASTVSAKRADDRPGVGKPLDGQEVRIVNGEIWLRSPTLALGYWQQGKLRPLTDADGWLHSGDLGAWRLDELCVLGRRDNLFFCGAEAVQPEVIERLLLRHPQVTQAVVVALEDDEYGSRPVALVNDGVAMAPLAAWALPQLAAWQRPVKWYTLPALGSGGIKPSRRQLMQWVAQQQEIDVVFPQRAS
ncbi:AMP-binding protein [Erwinia aphidicola]|uniref:AMP-binding protein n=1 Tax=Erwinia aphidicola TaxID=68334 RepID=UPI0030CC265E